jgi:hypothetical protein
MKHPLQENHSWTPTRRNYGTWRIQGPVKNDFVSGSMPSMPWEIADQASAKDEEAALLTKAGSLEKHPG